jgi:hypothetical protein
MSQVISWIISSIKKIQQVFIFDKAQGCGHYQKKGLHKVGIKHDSHLALALAFFW